MSSSATTIRYIEDQLAGLDIRTAPMFGEFGIYCDGKVVGLICDDTLFIKPSDADATLFEGTVEAPPYPGAKNYHSVPGDLLENSDWVKRAVQGTADALPLPKPKAAKGGKPRLSSGGGGI